MVFPSTAFYSSDTKRSVPEHLEVTQCLVLALTISLGVDIGSRFWLMLMVEDEHGERTVYIYSPAGK